MTALPDLIDAAIRNEGLCKLTLTAVRRAPDGSVECWSAEARYRDHKRSDGYMALRNPIAALEYALAPRTPEPPVTAEDPFA